MGAVADRRRADLWALLGGAPKHKPAILDRAVYPSPVKSVAAERLLLDLNGDEPVPAFFLRPEGVGRPPLALYTHAHGDNYDLGKDEVFEGRRALQKPPYALALVEAGYAVLAIDNWLFGERPRHGGEQRFARGRLLRGDTVFGMMLRDNHAALTLAIEALQVDASRVAITGLSMGASIAWWLHALDERIRVCVDLCCMTDFGAAISEGGIEGHGPYYIVPGLLKQFSTSSIVALGAPRPHLSMNGRLDPLTPESGLRLVDAEVGDVYAGMGASDAWRLEIHACGHTETPAMRAAALAFLLKWL